MGVYPERENLTWPGPTSDQKVFVEGLWGDGQNWRHHAFSRREKQNWPWGVGSGGYTSSPQQAAAVRWPAVRTPHTAGLNSATELEVRDGLLVVTLTDLVAPPHLS